MLASAAKKIEQIKETLEEQNPEALLCDGLDAALIGVGYRATKEAVAVYSYDKCVKVFMSQGMNRDEAVEYLDFNMLGAWVGEFTPIFIWTP